MTSTGATSKRRRIDQYLPSFSQHDAISNHVLQVRRALLDAGFESDIYADSWDDFGEAHAIDYRESSPADGQVVLYHVSTHSAMTAWLAERVEDGARLLVYYHNITPAAYFRRWLPEVARAMVAAREDLAQLGPSVELALTNSAFSRTELDQLGYRATRVAPLLVDLDDYDKPPRARTVAQLRLRSEGGARWLFVGRMAPNKCQHDLLCAFAVYRKAFDAHARLAMIGGMTAPRYWRAIEALAGEIGVGDAVELVNRADQDDLLAYFHASDVFVCLSEHEGFCVPILEAMQLSLPVVAYAAAAVPEAVGDAGVLLADKDPLKVAEAVNTLLADPDRVEAQVAAGRRRAEEFSLKHTSAQMVAELQAAFEAGA